MKRTTWLLLVTLKGASFAAGQELEETSAGALQEDRVSGEEATDEPAGYVYVDTLLVRERLENVLSRPEFARLRTEPKKEDPEDASFPDWLDRFADWLGSLFGDPGPAKESASSSFRFGSGGVWLLLMPAAILIAALVFVGRAVMSSAREKRVDKEESVMPRFAPGSAPGERTPGEYWRHAQELADRRDYKGAIRQLLLAAMSTLERRGLIRFRKGLTNRDYIWAAKGASQASLTTIVRQFEHVYFGRREATADGYSECRRELEKSFPLETP